MRVNVNRILLRRLYNDRSAAKVRCVESLEPRKMMAVDVSLQEQTPPAYVSADFNQDGAVDAADAGVLFQNWGKPGTADLNIDGIVDAADAAILFENWRESTNSASSPRNTDEVFVNHHATTTADVIDAGVLNDQRIDSPTTSTPGTISTAPSPTVTDIALVSLTDSDALSNTGTPLIVNARGIVDDIKNGIEDAIKRPWKEIERIFDNLKSFYENARKLIEEGLDILKTAKDTLSALKDAGSSLGDLITSSLSMLASQVGGIANISDKLLAAIPRDFVNLTGYFLSNPQADLVSTLESVLGISFGPRNSDAGCGIAKFGLWLVPDKIGKLDLSAACAAHDQHFNLTPPKNVSVLQNLLTNLHSNAVFFVDIIAAGIKSGDPESILITPVVATVYTAAVTAAALGAAAKDGSLDLIDGSQFSAATRAGLDHAKLKLGPDFSIVPTAPLPVFSSGAKPLAESPERYPHSSYAGYARKTRRIDWIEYDQHHRYWAARHGGDPESAYRQFVKAGMVTRVDPTMDRLKDWVYGSEEFLRKMVRLTNEEDESTEVRRGIRKSKHSVEAVITATAKEYGVETEDYKRFRSRAAGRDVAAYLCRRYTTATLAELSHLFGLSHRDSSSDLVKRAERNRKENAAIDRRIRKIEKRLCLNPESRV